MSKYLSGGVMRSRWAAIGAALAVTVGAGGVLTAHAASGDTSNFVPITPCRLFDTRAASAVGTRTSPIVTDQTITFTVRGTNGDCTIPANATGVAANVTAVDGTSSSFLTIWPSDVARPNSSTNNWTSAAATPNKVDVKLSADGKISVYNKAGIVNVIADVVGYYVPASDPAITGGVQFASARGPGVNGQVQLDSLSLESVLDLVLTAPAPGYAVLTATSQMVVPAGTGVNCEISTTIQVGTTGVQPASTDALIFSQTQGFAVPQGETTFHLVCERVFGSGTALVQATYMTAVFSPNKV